MAHGADKSLSTTLCGLVKDVTPKVRTYRPEGARAQLVIATAEAFNYDPTTLRRVQEDIDKVTTASCPQDREALLAILKLPSLGEAVRERLLTLARDALSSGELRTMHEGISAPMAVESVQKIRQEGLASGWKRERVCRGPCPSRTNQGVLAPR